MKSISDTVKEILDPFLSPKGLELYDLAFVKEGPHHYLRVFIDSEKGISLKECEEVSKFL
ncbi:MAG: ribosome maturation factor RimP, partial [Tissierellia bacterium]|nr:ribosome maturation factor RimP [Tissierellia bacterium]